MLVVPAGVLRVVEGRLLTYHVGLLCKPSAPLLSLLPTEPSFWLCFSCIVFNLLLVFQSPSFWCEVYKLGTKRSYLLLSFEIKTALYPVLPTSGHKRGRCYPLYAKMNNNVISRVWIVCSRDANELVTTWKFRTSCLEHWQPRNRTMPPQSIYGSSNIKSDISSHFCFAGFSKSIIQPIHRG